ncbi:hypothetical protein [Winogradskyella vincentii]|uniref:Uncharacterized protein n=1 Tax=Winogradskyella vincentii TaxID=2877122 RepID=A0ABS7XXB8_9FLAO|nr:hypothetical protein [Winogradskyella vincentii]MCA0151679.1 hypothetical protein [Winogradskyella vincentii]
MKFKIIIVIALVLLVTVSCKQKKGQGEKQIQKTAEYELVDLGSGILVEQFDSIVKDENKYNRNNKVFKVGNVFEYAFKHITVDGKTKYYKIDEDKIWDFVEEVDQDSTTITSVKISVQDENAMARHIPDYNQTNLKYLIDKNIGYSTSGAIENEANIWIHPPRDRYFEILELNPFPYIKLPAKIGDSWTWNLRIGDGWSDHRWKVWEGQIENNYEYKITDKRNISTEFGKLKCLVVESNAKSRIGETKLTSYFHNKYGFVKLEYTNIDGSKTILELVNFKTKDDK